MIPLFERYPSLRATLPFVALGAYPTPLLDAARLDAGNQCAGITIKHDGVSGRPYGGNKVRKLEFLLGDAQARGKTEVLTFGGAGSNHALATAMYAKKLGLASHLLLLKQPNSHSLRSNLLRLLKTGARLRHFESMTGLVAGTILQSAGKLAAGKELPYFIAPGGSSPLGLLGYVNAAFELNAQVASGELEPPDVIYIACGTMGSSVGLALGLAILGLKTRVCSVAVTDTRFSSMARAKKMFRDATALLIEADSSIPGTRFEDCGLELRHDFFGGEYGRYTDAGIAAVRQLEAVIGLRIEGCYTGKCLAALIEDLRADRLAGRRVLFWNTYDAQGTAHSSHGLDYHDLPNAFHQYFEDDVQPLDRSRS